MAISGSGGNVCHHDGHAEDLAAGAGGQYVSDVDPGRVSQTSGDPLLQSYSSVDG